ncbi:transcriptional regulator [Catellatospora sp. IY07-71]|uniref:LuxR C-terminal-related transcriptional regulator n=1 Tax=Catellatospora sp. IY07-71 TaxID=2728827 RepID=UPI001BB4428F|nr:LuxR family transcriptional regulator [Catellatospora sp. IY07-71]BCJ78057.1 transcriptional regulator [Catellatospora sp. IY07-71]
MHIPTERGSSRPVAVAPRPAAPRLPLRGREREQQTIAALLATAASGAGGALLLHGDLGNGKTALLRAAAATLPEGTRLLESTGLAEEADLPYAGLQGLLQPVTDRIALLPPLQARVLTGALSGAGCADGDRLALAMAVLTLLGELGREHLVLCCVDDVHALDRPSLDVIAFVARRLRAYRVALLLTASAEPALSGVPLLPVRELDPRASRAMLADLLRGEEPDGPLTAHLLPGALDGDGGDGDPLAALAALGGGNPRALTDLAASLTDSQRRGEAPLPTRLPADSALLRAYRARLDRLPSDTRWLLLLAAADEENDAAGLVRAALGSGVDIAALAPAEDAGLVRVGRGGIVFPQPLARTLAYEEAPLAQRRAAHLHLARSLDPDRERLRRAVHLAAAAYGPDARLAAELEDAAGDGGFSRASAALEHAAQLTTEPAGAASRLVTAARYAWQSGSPHRARSLLRRAHPVTRDRATTAESEVLSGEIELRAGATVNAVESLLALADRLAGTHRELAVLALLRASEAVCFSGDHPRYVEVATRAAALRRPGDPADLEVVFEHIAGFGATFLGRHDRALRPLRRTIDLGAALDSAAPLTCAAASALLLADDVGAHRLAARAVEVARDTGDVSALPLALEMAAYAEYWLGRYDAAAATSLQGLRAARACGQGNYAGDHQAMLAVLAAIRGERELSLRRIRDIEVAPGTGQTNRPKALSQWALAVLDLLAGRPADTVTRIAAIACPRTGRGHVVVQAMATPWLVEAAVRADGREQAVAALAGFDGWAASTGDPVRRALSARCHALLAPRGSAAAEEHFQQALTLHLAGEADFERARTELLFGQELRRARRPRDAREHLHHALETFTRLDVPAWTDQARAELRAAGEAVDAPAVRAADVLTAQQLQIARLVRDGATNREVAAHLFLSTRTVDHHMRNIFARLNIRSRTELAKALT